MSLDHERVEELLAGYALMALSGEDALEADRLLADHVPFCPLCREALAGFQSVTADLGLSAEPARPPDLVLARIRRGMADAPSPGRLRRRAVFVAAAAGVAALVAMGGLSLSMGSRVSRAESQTATALELVSAMRSPGAEQVDLSPQGATPKDTAFVHVSAPQVKRIYLASNACPEPAAGYAYQLWLGSGGRYEPVGPMFRPDNGQVLIELTVDVARHDEVVVSEELAGSTPGQPSTTGRSWRATL